MRARFRIWGRQLYGWISPVASYLVTVCLGASGILFARAVPSAYFEDFNLLMLLASGIFFLGGLLLRLFWGARGCGLARAATQGYR